jgi:hypothetical protein
LYDDGVYGTDSEEDAYLFAGKAEAAVRLNETFDWFVDLSSDGAFSCVHENREKFVVYHAVSNEKCMDQEIEARLCGKYAVLCLL